jgi:hypothetical protein
MFLLVTCYVRLIESQQCVWYRIVLSCRLQARGKQSVPQQTNPTLGFCAGGRGYDARDVAMTATQGGGVFSRRNLVITYGIG